MSALARMAANESKWLKLTPDDTVVLSSHPIPGNEMDVTKVIDALFRLGVDVVHSGIEDVHATGHAKAEELKTVLSITQPQWFTPVHGEYHHLVSHARIAASMGVDVNRINVCEDGDQLIVTDDGVTKLGPVPASYLYVDGAGVGDISHGVLRDRRVLAEEGVVIVYLTVDAHRREVLGGPEVISRGWIDATEEDDLIVDCSAIVTEAVMRTITEGGAVNIEALQKVVRHAVGRFVSARTRRRPMIVPLVIEV